MVRHEGDMECQDRQNHKHTKRGAPEYSPDIEVQRRPTGLDRSRDIIRTNAVCTKNEKTPKRPSVSVQTLHIPNTLPGKCATMMQRTATALSTSRLFRLAPA